MKPTTKIAVCIFSILPIVAAQASAEEKTKTSNNAKVLNRVMDLMDGLSKCSKINEPLDRLKCFDHLSGRKSNEQQKEPQKIEAPNPNGKWNLKVEIDPIDDSERFNLSIVSEDSKSIAVLKCINKKYDFVISTPEILLNLTPGELKNMTGVTSRFGKNLAEDMTWELSFNRKSAFLKRDAIGAFTQKFFYNDVYTAKFYTNAHEFIVVFDIRGFENAIKPMLDKCNIN